MRYGTAMCEWGQTRLIRVHVPAYLSSTGRARWAYKPIDWCISDIVAALTRAGIRTQASCCGHGRIPGWIGLEDGRELWIVDRRYLRRPIGWAIRLIWSHVRSLLSRGT